MAPFFRKYTVATAVVSDLKVFIPRTIIDSLFFGQLLLFGFVMPPAHLNWQSRLCCLCVSMERKMVLNAEKSSTGTGLFVRQPGSPLWNC